MSGDDEAKQVGSSNGLGLEQADDELLTEWTTAHEVAAWLRCMFV